MGTILVRIVAPVSTDGARRHESIQALCDVVHRLNVSFLRANPNFPPLYRSGVRYGREPIAEREQFCTAPATLVQGWGDCDDLAPWRSAELVVRRGLDARPLVTQVRPGLWHVVVELGGGRIEDPSRVLGM